MPEEKLCIEKPPFLKPDTVRKGGFYHAEAQAILSNRKSQLSKLKQR